MIRVDPDTGYPIEDTSSFNGQSTQMNNQSALNQGRVAAYGFRNPFRLTVRPGTNEAWVGDVGWHTWEEIDRIQPSGPPKNYGWPCVEGDDLHPRSWASLNLDMCNNLYANGDGANPYFSYEHEADVVPGENCDAQNGSSLSGLQFYEPTPGSEEPAFPASYDDGLFFADYSRRCIWFMPAGQDGLPDPGSTEIFEEGVGAVDLKLGADGALYYPAIASGQIHRITYEPENQSPVAKVIGTPDHGAAPLEVHLDASMSSDPEGDALSYGWDLDGDGEFDDSTDVSIDHTFDDPGTYDPRVEVTDEHGASSKAGTEIVVGSPPVPTIESPDPGEPIPANQTFAFSGAASDVQDGTIPATSLDWSAELNHCMPEGGCHKHPIQGFDGVAGGEMQMPAHERPYFLTLTLTAHDSDGLVASTSIDIQPAPNEAPEPTIDVPSGHQEFSSGEEIGFSGSAVDREDQSVPVSGLSWRLVDASCSQDPCSEWPLVIPDGSPFGDFVAPTDPFSGSLRLELTAVDSDGDRATTSEVLAPRLVHILLVSRRDGARVNAANVKGRVPLAIDVLRGSEVLISTPRRQAAKGSGKASKLLWRRWSDGGGRAHFVDPTRDRTFKASYELKLPDKRSNGRRR